MDISDNEIYKTDSLPGKLKMCVGQELRMLTANINTSGSVKNGVHRKNRVHANA